MPTIRHALVASLTRRYPFISGCGTIANSSLVRKASGAAGGLVWARNDRGQQLLVPFDDFVGRAIYFVGDLDRKLSRLVGRIVREGDTVLDIGANLGAVALPLSALVGPTGSVHAFEPNPAMADLLAQSLERNKATNVQLHRVALGGEPGTLPLHIPEANAGMGTLKPGDGRFGRRVDVEVKRLDDVIEEAGIGPVRLVKIDVEGFEAEVFSGARRWLGSTPPDAIVFEFNDALEGFWSAPLIELLREFEFDLYSIPKRLMSLALTPLAAGSSAIPAAHDFLAIHRRARSPVVPELRG